MSGGRPAEIRHDDDYDDADGRWLTAAELAASRSTSIASAARLIRRRKWPHRVDNLTQTVRYLVPHHELQKIHTSQGQSAPSRRRSRR